MNTHELHTGPNGKAAELQTIIESDGPLSVSLRNEGDAEYALAMTRGAATLASAPTSEYQVEDQVQIVVNSPDGSETAFVGVVKGNSPAPHPILILGTNGATSIPGTRTLTSSGADFVAAGVKAGDVLLVNESSTDDGLYIVAEVTSTTVLTIERDWPAGSGASQDFWVYGRCVVAPGSVKFTVVITGTAATVYVTDDGEGILYGLIAADPLKVINGTFDYFTGKWAIVCETALNNASDIKITYAESLPVVAGGKISFPISNSRHEEPISFKGIGNGDNVQCLVKIWTG